MASKSACVSFDALFGSSSGDVSPDRLEGILDQVVRETFQSLSLSPHELVHVVDEKGIRWMTASEAEAILAHDGGDDDGFLKRKIQNSLRGNAQVLAQELKVLLVLTNQSLKRYREHQLIPLPEIQRIEPNVLRLGRQIGHLLTELQAAETRIRQTRQCHPVLKEFEDKVGQLLLFQRQGMQNEAYQLAQNLASMKKKYLLASRGLNSENHRSVQLRTDLQRQKKSLLSWQRYLSAQREGTLQVEIQGQRKTVDNLKVLLAKSTLDQQDEYKQRLSERTNEMEKNQNELQAVQTAQVMLKKEEEATEAVIQQYQNQLREAGVEDKATAPEGIAPPSAPLESAPPPAESAAAEKPEEKTSFRRMATVQSKRR